jgi:hypothetical protein
MVPTPRSPNFDFIGATASATANFGTGVVALQTTNSQRQYVPSGETSAMPQLDFAGNMHGTAANTIMRMGRISLMAL